MTPEQISNIVDTIISLRDNDDRMQVATDAYFKVIHPDSYAPIIEWNCTYALNIVNIVHHDIADWLWYYLYEVSWLKRRDAKYDVRITQNWKEWKMNTVEDLKTFLISEYAVS